MKLFDCTAQFCDDGKLNWVEIFTFFSDEDDESKRAVSIEFQLHPSLDDVTMQANQNEYVPEHTGVDNPYTMATQDYGSCSNMTSSSQQDISQPQLIVPSAAENDEDDPIYSSVVEDDDDMNLEISYELKNNPIYSETNY